MVFSFLLVALGVLNLKVQPTQAASTYLHTSGNKILDSSNAVVGLSGVNWFGFETANNAPHGLWSRNWQDMLDQIKDLGYNVIRLPFSDAMLQPGVAPSGIDYNQNPDLAGLTSLQVMDKIVSGAEQRGIKIILDNHRSTAGNGPESNGLWYTSDYPESRWVDDWKMLVARYRGSAAVIGVDLRNEPHGDACWGCGDPALDWRLAAEKAGNAILAINPNLLVIVEGNSNYNGQSNWWGGNLMGAGDNPVRLSVPNRLVYSIHEYPESVAYQPWFGDANYPNNLPSVWDQYWGYLIKNNTAPILVGEFGTRYQTVKDQQWMQTFSNYTRQNGLSWTFWSLNPDSGDTGGILNDDWTSVNQTIQDILQPMQYPMLDAPSQPPAPTPTAGPTLAPTQPTPVPTTGPAPTQTPPPVSPPPDPGGSTWVLDDFEPGSAANWNDFQDANSSVSTGIVSPGKIGDGALKMDYRLDSQGWGGAGVSYASALDWSAYSTFSFEFNGGNTGNTIRLELLDDRAPGSSGDTSERYVYQFSDNFSGWKTFTLPWKAFTRRADWQPEGAPNNGLNLSSIWGFNFSPTAGSGSFQIDQVQLARAAPPASSAVLDDFEQGNTGHWNTFSDDQSQIQVKTVSPGKVGDYAMHVSASIASSGWAGVEMQFASPKDWSGYNGIAFWLYGNNSGNPIRLEVLDNRSGGGSEDTCERYVYQFKDNWSGWKHFSLSWSDFSRRSDWQPTGAPDDGFNRMQIWGLNFSPISGSVDFRLDELKLVGP